MIIHRQGDVMTIATDMTIPENAVEIPRHNGNVVLAFGEATGHCHRIEDSDARMFSMDGEELLVIADIIRDITPRDIIGTITDETGTWLRVTYDRNRIIRLAESMRDEVESLIRADGVLKIRGSLLVHEEHDSHVIEPGVHILPGQRQYTMADQAPLRVAD